MTWAAQSTGEDSITSVSRMTGPVGGGNSDLTFYFDGDKQWTENVLLDTAPEGTAMRLGSDATYERPLTGALDEAYIYASALDASAIEVLYGSVSAAPTVTPVPTSQLFETTLIAYYPFTDGTTQDVHHSWNGVPESMTTTEGRDGGTAIVLDAERWESVWLPWEVVRDLDGDADRTLCLWARIDEWKGGYLFHYGGSYDGGDELSASFGLRVGTVEGDLVIIADDTQRQ